MNRVISLLCAGVLASAIAFSPTSTAPAMADEDMGVRAYMSLKLGSGEPIKDRAQYGFQINQSWDNDDEVIDPFATPINLTLFDFATNGEGVTTANVLGLDTIKAYDMLTGRDRLNANGGDGDFEKNELWMAGVIIVVPIFTCFAAQIGPCKTDDDKRFIKVEDDHKNNIPSDLRLKRDVTYLATLGSGIKVYSFRYLWSETVLVGVMAQDLLSHEAYRYAVVLKPSGFYAVDYAMLGLKMTTFAEWRAQGQSAVLLRPVSTRASRLSAALAH